MSAVYALFTLFVVLSVLDGITTYQALKRPGTREANPVMRWLFKRFGVRVTLVTAKAAAIAALWLTLDPDLPFILVAIDLAYAFVVWRNHFSVGR